MIFITGMHQRIMRSASTVEMKDRILVALLLKQVRWKAYDEPIPIQFQLENQKT